MTNGHPSLLLDTFRFVQQYYQFLKEELKYVKHLFGGLSSHSLQRLLNPQAHIQAKTLKPKLSAIEHYFQQIDNKNYLQHLAATAELHNSHDIDKFLEALDKILLALREAVPLSLHNIMISSVQRKHRERPFSSPHTRARYAILSPAEAHPTYPLDMQCVETILEHYFRALFSTLDPFIGTNEISPPVITFLDGLMFETTLDTGSPLVSVSHNEINPFAPPSPEESLKLFMEALPHQISLYRIGGPRWLPVAIRHAPVLAHEIGHIFWDVLRQIIGFRMGGKVSLPGSNVSIQLWGATDFERVYRNALPSIDQLRHHYLRVRRSFNRGYNRLKKAFFPSMSKKEFSKVGDAHVKELFCDALAILLAGPSYAYSGLPILLTTAVLQHTPRNCEDCWYTKAMILHPPLNVRYGLMVEVLKILGFPEAAKHVERMLPTQSEARKALHMDCVNFQAAYWKHLETPQRKTLRSRLWNLLSRKRFPKEETPSFVEAVCDFIRKLSSMSKEKNAFGDTHLNGKDEKAVVDEWRSLYAAVDQGCMLPEQMNANLHNTSVTPAIIINAIWQKHIDRNEKSPKVYQHFHHDPLWRMAIENLTRFQ